MLEDLGDLMFVSISFILYLVLVIGVCLDLVLEVCWTRSSISDRWNALRFLIFSIRLMCARLLHSPATLD